jgi:hypothetical protein
MTQIMSLKTYVLIQSAVRHEYNNFIKGAINIGNDPVIVIKHRNVLLKQLKQLYNKNAKQSLRLKK